MKTCHCESVKNPHNKFILEKLLDKSSEYSVQGTGTQFNFQIHILLQLAISLVMLWNT